MLSLLDLCLLFYKLVLLISWERFVGMTLVAFRGSWVLGGRGGAVLSSSWLTETGSADVGVWHGRRGAVSNLDSELLPQRPRCPAGFQSGWARLPLWSVQVGERSHGVSSCRWVITDSIASLRLYLNQPLESVVIKASFFFSASLMTMQGPVSLFHRNPRLLNFRWQYNLCSRLSMITTEKKTPLHALIGASGLCSFLPSLVRSSSSSSWYACL